MKHVSELEELCCLMCDPKEKPVFIENLQRWIERNQDIDQYDAAREFCFNYCLENKPKAKIKQTAKIKRKRGKTVHTEVDQNEQESAFMTKKYLSNRNKTEREKKTLHKAISHCAFICNLEQEDQEKIVEKLIPFFVPKGISIIREDTSGEFFALIYHGLFDVIVGKKHTAILRPGDLFGEVSLLHQTTRNATIVSRTDAVIFCIDRFYFQKIVVLASQQRRELYRKFLQSIPLFSVLTSVEISSLINALELVQYNQGELIMKQGEKGDSFFIVKEGQASVYKEENKKEVAVLEGGNWFGEIALIKNSTRTATVIAKTNLKCLKLGRDLFLHLLGPQIRMRLNKDKANAMKINKTPTKKEF